MFACAAYFVEINERHDSQYELTGIWVGFELVGWMGGIWNFDIREIKVSLPYVGLIEFDIGWVVKLEVLI